MAKPRREERVRERGREGDTLEPRITTARKEAEANSAPYGAAQRPYWPMRPQAWGGRARLEPSDRGQLRVANGPLRRVVLAGQTIDYRLIRARRRSIGMEVHFEGLTVRAPRWVTLRDIEAALVERATWILRSLAEWRARRRNVMPREWKSGAPIVFRGAQLALAVHPARRAEIAADLFHVTVRHPHAHDERQVADCVGQWLRDQAWMLVAARVAHYVRRVSARTPSVRLSNARSEWGSCNAKGEIRLNWRLVQLPPLLAEYVVAHEVAHIIELNHSQRFWAEVEALLPGHAALRRQLDDWTALLAA
ncbi:MAG: M48 family metallopeptidase [Pseudomonadota bacterium]|nr:M48 family metallopeptidase [Pseudomonadota bacterium]